jgi:uncharacterized membrane protein HdeD (DUF308 family)
MMPGIINMIHYLSSRIWEWIDLSTQHLQIMNVLVKTCSGASASLSQFWLAGCFYLSGKHIPGLVEAKRRGNSPEAVHTKYEPAMFDIFPSVDTAVPVP